MGEMTKIGKGGGNLVFSLLLAAATAALFPKSASAAVSNLESYHFRHDFSTGSRVFTGGAKCPADFIGNTSADSCALEGPNGSSSAMHVGGCYGPIKINGVEVDNYYLNTNDWTLAVSFRPGSVEKGIIIAVGRLNLINNKGGRIDIAVCSSSDPSKLYIQEFYRSGSNAAKGNSVTLTNLGNVTNGFHSLVLAYSKSAKTVTPYFDGVKKDVLTLTSKETTSRFVGNYFNYGSLPSVASLPSGYSSSYTNTDVAFYNVRFYFGAFSAADAAAYAALYPADRMGAPFRPNAYVEASATNTAANPMTNPDTEASARPFRGVPPSPMPPAAAASPAK